MEIALKTEHMIQENNNNICPSFQYHYLTCSKTCFISLTTLLSTNPPYIVLVYIYRVSHKAQFMFILLSQLLSPRELKKINMYTEITISGIL